MTLSGSKPNLLSTARLSYRAIGDDTAYNPREDDKIYAGTRLLDSIENQVIGGARWWQEQSKDKEGIYDDMFRLVGGGAKNVATAISYIPGIKQLGQLEDWVAAQARSLSTTIAPELDPRYAGWLARFGTGVLTDKGLGVATKAAKASILSKIDDFTGLYSGVGTAMDVSGGDKLTQWRLRTLERLQGLETNSGKVYNTIDDVPDLRIDRSEIYKKFGPDIEDKLFEYEYGALAHRELGKGTLAGFRPFKDFTKRGLVDPDGELWIFRSKGSRGEKVYQWDKATQLAGQVSKRRTVQRQVLNKIDSELRTVEEALGMDPGTLGSITNEQIIAQNTRTQLNNQLKKDAIGLEGDALLHFKQFNDFHVEHVLGVLQYPEFINSPQGRNWIINRIESGQPAWSVVLSGRHNKWFVDTVQDVFATPTSKRAKSGYRRPKIAGKDLGLGTHEGKRLFTYPEVTPNYTGPGSLPGDMMISTWDGTKTWRVPRVLAALNFIPDKNIRRQLLQGTKAKGFKDGFIGRILAGERIADSTSIIGTLFKRAEQLGIDKDLLRKYWNNSTLSAKHETLALLEQMGATEKFLKQLGAEFELFPDKGTPYTIKGDSF